MQKKIFFRLFLIVGFLGVSSCSGSSWWGSDESQEYIVPEEKIVVETPPLIETDEALADVRVDEPSNPNELAMIYNKRVPPLNSLLVCRDKQCAPADLSMTKEYIYNTLAHLVDNNLDTTALLCEANAQAHVCINPYITVPARVGVTPAYVYFDGVKLIDGTAVKGETALNLALGYNLSYNGQTPTVCKPDTAMLYVKGNNEIVLNGNGFKCEMTSVGATTIRIMFTIDYIDMDYGYLGGYYSIGLSGPAMGGGNGYGMIRLPKDAHPLNPVLRAPTPGAHTGAYNFNPQAAATQQPASPQVKPRINPEALRLPQNNAVAPSVVPGVSAQDTVEVSAGVPNVHQYQANDGHDNLNAVQPVSASSSNSPSNVSQAATDSKGVVYETISLGGNGPAYEEVYVEDLEDYVK